MHIGSNCTGSSVAISSGKVISINTGKIISTGPNQLAKTQQVKAVVHGKTVASPKPASALSSMSSTSHNVSYSTGKSGSIILSIIPLFIC